MFRGNSRQKNKAFAHTPLVWAALLLAVAGLLAGCGTNRNTAMSRNWQAFTTRYNVYFNGEQNYSEQLKLMESKYEDDYTRRTLMHPAEARSDQKRPQPSGDFKRTIEKMQKAIQLHSISKKPKKRTSTPKDKAFRAREEFNPFLHNAWLMMGRAQYYGGDFTGAAATFAYIQRHYKWNQEIVDEARLWQVLSYLAMDWLYEADNILTHIKRDKLTTSKLQQLYDFTEADYLVRSNSYKEAVPYLEAAAKSAHGSQKNRLYFLLGQLQADMGNPKAAYLAYGKAGSGSGTDYRTKFNARIKQSEVYTGTNIKKEVAALKSMARYSRNKEYLDQIYYAIGNLYLSRKDSTNAEKNYRTAIEKSTRNSIDKAMAQLALGSILFDKHDYVGAQPCYSEAVPQLPDTYPNYKTLKRRSDVLDELANYAGNVHLQDSLLTLSKMSEEDQLKACQKLAADYEKKKKEEEANAKLEEYMNEQQAQGSTVNDKNGPSQFQLNTDKSWYFYNTQSKNAGKTTFQRQWGARKNEDDWRRRNKNTFSFDNDEDSEEDDDDSKKTEANDSTANSKEQLDLQSDPTKPEYYLKDIPHTETEIATCNEIIQEGLYNMGVILKDKLEDYTQAKAMFLELLERYPDNTYRLDVYYNLYLMAARSGDTAEAEKYRGLILSDFPESNYGKAMVDPAYFDNLRRMNSVQEELYDKAYQAYLNNQNTQVHNLVANMEKDYPLSKILPKFVFIDALSYVTDGDEEKFKERLNELLQKWPTTDMTETASSMLKYANSGRKLSAGGSNQRGMLWEIRLTNASDDENGEGGKANDTPAKFDLNPNKPQLLVFAFPLDSVSPNQLLYDVARHNFSSFVVKDFDLEQMSFSNIGLLIVKGFANTREVEHYRTVMASDKSFTLPEQVRPIMISVDNFQLLLREGRSFEEYFNFEEKERARLTEQNVVGEDNYLPGGATDPQGEQVGEPDKKPTPEATGEAAPTENAEASEAQEEAVEPEESEPIKSAKNPEEEPQEEPEEESQEEDAQQ